jgi:hypothetical protein
VGILIGTSTFRQYLSVVFVARAELSNYILSCTSYSTGRYKVGTEFETAIRVLVAMKISLTFVLLQIRNATTYPLQSKFAPTVQSSYNCIVAMTEFTTIRVVMLVALFRSC